MVAMKIVISNGQEKIFSLCLHLIWSLRVGVTSLAVCNAGGINVVKFIMWSYLVKIRFTVCWLNTCTLKGYDAPKDNFETFSIYPRLKVLYLR